MHIIIAVLTAVGGILWALNRLQHSGLDLNAFNPFVWARRRKWEQKLGTKAIHQLENPMESAALLVVAVASLNGDITRDLKNEIIEMFINEFGISTENANQFYSSSIYILKDAGQLSSEVPNILAPTKKLYQPRHIETLFKMLHSAAAAESTPSTEQQAFIAAVKSVFEQGQVPSSKW